MSSWRGTPKPNATETLAKGIQETILQSSQNMIAAIDRAGKSNSTTENDIPIYEWLNNASEGRFVEEH
jgi:hypothetical protein